MEHDRWLDKLSRLFDAELTGTERSDAEAHLKNCADCKETWRLWSESRSALSRLKQADLGPGFRVKVMDALDGSSASASEPRLTWAPWLGLAAAAALTLALSLPAPETEGASADPTGLLAFASTSSLPSNPVPDWMTETNP
jgi:anti-sigma factor RsiW